MRLSRFAPALAGCLLLLSWGARPARAANAEIQAGDALFSQRTPSTGAAAALSQYEKAMDGPDRPEALWKAARALHWIGDQSSNRKEKLAAFEKGLAYAKEAVARAPERPEPHFWLAALYGSYGEARGVLKSLALVGPLREQLEAINRIDEHFQGGAGWRVLGIVDYKVPGFAGGSKKRALERLQKAMAMDPTNAFNVYYMAEGSAECGRRDDAARYLDALARLTPTADVDAADLASMQRKGEAFRAKLKS
jgi:tetratricopeptide (TPR) repeat protein